MAGRALCFFLLSEESTRQKHPRDSEEQNLLLRDPPGHTVDAGATQEGCRRQRANLDLGFCLY